MCVCVCAQYFYSVFLFSFFILLVALPAYAHLCVPIVKSHRHIAVQTQCPLDGLNSYLCIYIWKHLRKHWQTQSELIWFLTVSSSCLPLASHDVMPKTFSCLGNPPDKYVCDQRPPCGATYEGSKIDNDFGTMQFRWWRTAYFLFHSLVNHWVILKDGYCRGGWISLLPTVSSKDKLKDSWSFLPRDGSQGKLGILAISCSGSHTCSCMDIISHAYTFCYICLQAQSLSSWQQTTFWQQSVTFRLLSGFLCNLRHTKLHIYTCILSHMYMFCWINRTGVITGVNPVFFSQFLLVTDTIQHGY